MTDEKIIKSNTIYMYMTSFLGSQQFIAPILIIYYTRYIGVSLSQYFIIDSVLFFTIAIFEVPSGYISDRFGRKKVLLISQFMMLISLLIPIIFKNFNSAMISIFILGISSSLASGNAQAIIFESLKSKFKSVISKSSNIMFIMSMIAGLLSGFIFKINMALPMILDIFCLLISIAITYKFLYDDEAYKKNIKKINTLKENIIKAKFPIKNVLLIFIINALFFSIFRTSYTFYQPIFESSNISIEYFGVIFSIFNIFSLLGSYLFNKIDRLLCNETRVTNFFAIVLIISAIGIYLTNNYLVLIFILIQQVIRGMYTPSFKYYTNCYIPEYTTKRTTYLSVNSLVSTIITAISLSISSYLNSSFNVTNSLLRINIIIIFLLVIVNYINFYYKKKGDIKCYLDQ